MNLETELSDKIKKYRELVPKIEALIDPKCGMIANCANVSAAIQAEFGHWWCGFYIVNSDNKLELGPFQGPVACTLIDYNKGVCGKAWAEAKSIVVPDVHKFEGHIACSAESNSEIVVPVFKDNKVVAVLDIDSVLFSAFDETDRIYLEQITALL